MAKPKKKKPRTSGIPVVPTQRKRDVNPEALAALTALFEKHGRPENAKWFVRAYAMIFEYGPITGYDLDDRARSEGCEKWQSIHSLLNPMRKYGLIEYVGKVKADTGGTRKLFDVTSKVPTVLPSWNKHFGDNGKPSWKRNGNKHRGTANVTLSDAAWLRTSAEALSKLLDIQDRLGKYYAPECRRAVTFLKDEAARCEQNKGA
jgi:hypothetical protein